VSFVQKLILAAVPRSWAAAMEAESKAWIARCESCGGERSIWDLGGIRWKAAGRPRRRFECPGCKRVAWHSIDKI
jgi:hypothetical protein